MAWFFAFFLISGFCSLVYQVVWLRLAMAGFGVTAPMVSIVLSTFMGGLALGSWAAGRLARRASGPSLPLRLYALAELGIALGGVLVPAGLVLGRQWLAGAADVEWGSLRHYVASGASVAVVLLPFCACMGATFPLAMWAIRGRFPARSPRSFSYLYLANVVGAALGTLASAFVLIELLGFRRTALLAAALNALLAAAAGILSLGRPAPAAPVEGAGALEPRPLAPERGSLRPVPWLLFSTGLSSMGMEVVWVRQFTPYLGTVVYAFAAIVALYLLATSAGSWAYRRWPRAVASGAPGAWLWPALALSALLPLWAADPRLPLPEHMSWGAARVAGGIAPLCALLGFVTPWLLDRWSRGDANRAGGAYALNVVGCILGPLLAGFLLLPALGERGTLVLLAVPLFAVGFAAARPEIGRPAAVAWALALAGSLVLLGGTRDFATLFPRRVVLRDHAATVIAAGQGQSRRLLVNGVGMTVLTPITKLMAHLPLAFTPRPPRDGLVVCFGMGTSFRSLLSWGIESTAVELVPSVPRLFGFFHADGDRWARSPLARIVIDDGRRFLERTRQDFDVITIDPPPPVEAAGSSLLYSREFYRLAKRRLRPGGVLQQWVPEGDGLVFASFTRALTQSFPHVRAFRSLRGIGVHYLASDQRLPPLTAAELAARLPPGATADMLEWGPAESAEEQLALVLDQEVPLTEFLQQSPGAPALTDDRPFNEYYWLRRLRSR